MAEKDTDLVEKDDRDLVLTTTDNPHNPKTDYDKWKMWDEDKGHNTEQYIARLLVMEDEFDVDDEIKINSLMNKVVQDILEHDMTQMYTLI